MHDINMSQLNHVHAMDYLNAQIGAGMYAADGPGMAHAGPTPIEHMVDSYTRNAANPRGMIPHATRATLGSLPVVGPLASYLYTRSQIGD